MKIPIVNNQDEIIGYKEREEITKQDIYRVAGLWVFDKEGNILLAQRSFSKKNDPGLWGPAVAGTVEEGETYESNIIKEAEEEIGLTNIKITPGLKSYRNVSNQYFSKRFFAIVDHNYPFKKQDEEVEAIKWFSKQDFLKLVEEKPEIFIPSISNFTKEIIEFIGNETQG